VVSSHQTLDRDVSRSGDEVERDSWQPRSGDANLLGWAEFMVHFMNSISIVMEHMCCSADELAWRLIFQVERVAAASISPEVFTSRYVNRCVPVVLTGAMESWPAFGKWSLEYFKESHGDAEVCSTAVRTSPRVTEVVKNLYFLCHKVLRQLPCRDLQVSVDWGSPGPDRWRRMKLGEYIDKFEEYKAEASSSGTAVPYLRTWNAVVRSSAVGPSVSSLRNSFGVAVYGCHVLCRMTCRSFESITPRPHTSSTAFRDWTRARGRRLSGCSSVRPVLKRCCTKTFGALTRGWLSFRDESISSSTTQHTGAHALKTMPQCSSISKIQRTSSTSFPPITSSSVCLCLHQTLLGD
jgi:hypothetical protein